MVLFLFIWPTNARFDNEMNADQPASESPADEASDEEEGNPEEEEEEEEKDDWLPK
ncbi:MAG: hypothetical protein BWY72_02325 [Bacteroidetes bacterium ADurb.Bin416]|nr:MAG: hypothetical protein BWY72_02325 [Bacteroidetes bacterium ADurb.Bin416]